MCLWVFGCRWARINFKLNDVHISGNAIFRIQMKRKYCGRLEWKEIYMCIIKNEITLIFLHIHNMMLLEFLISSGRYWVELSVCCIFLLLYGFRISGDNDSESAWWQSDTMTKNGGRGAIFFSFVKVLFFIHIRPIWGRVHGETYQERPERSS